MFEKHWNDVTFRLPLRAVWAWLYRRVGKYRMRWGDYPMGHWKREAVIRFKTMSR